MAKTLDPHPVLQGRFLTASGLLVGQAAQGLAKGVVAALQIGLGLRGRRPAGQRLSRVSRAGPARGGPGLRRLRSMRADERFVLEDGVGRSQTNA